jgi:hypothetical protein
LPAVQRFVCWRAAANGLETTASSRHQLTQTDRRATSGRRAPDGEMMFERAIPVRPSSDRE